MVVFYNIHMLRNTFFIANDAELADDESVQEANPDPNFNPEAVELPVDVYILGRNLIVQTPIVAAGINDINVSLVGEKLTLTKSAGPMDEGDRYYHKECYWGDLKRVIHLPKAVDIDRVKATLNEGVLTVSLPLLEKTDAKIIRVK